MVTFWNIELLSYPLATIDDTCVNILKNSVDFEFKLSIYEHSVLFLRRAVLELYLAICVK